MMELNKPVATATASWCGEHPAPTGGCKPTASPAPVGRGVPRKWRKSWGLPSDSSDTQNRVPAPAGTHSPGCSTCRQGGGTPPPMLTWACHHSGGTLAPLHPHPGPCQPLAVGQIQNQVMQQLPGATQGGRPPQAGCRQDVVLAPLLPGVLLGCSTHTGAWLSPTTSCSTEHAQRAGESSRWGRGTRGCTGCCTHKHLPCGAAAPRVPALAAEKTHWRRPAAGRPRGSSSASPHSSRANGSCSQTCSRTH